MKRKVLASLCAAVAAVGISSLNAQQVTSGSVAHDESGRPVFLHQHLTPPSEQSVPAVAPKRSAASIAAAGTLVKVVPEAFISKNPTVDCGPGFVSQSNGGQVQAAWASGIGLPVSASNARQGLFLSKQLKTSDCSAGIANVTGISMTNPIFLTELGFDVDSAKSAPNGYSSNDKPLHCGPGAPRITIILKDGSIFAFACFFGTHTRRNSVGGAPPVTWDTVRFGDADASYLGGPTKTFPGFNTALIMFMQIEFDEGTDQGTGQTIIDNIDINGFLIGSSGGVTIDD
jgi:hypothetical protein